MKKRASASTILAISWLVISMLIVQTEAAGSLVGYWRFEEGSGTVANDSSGNGNTGTLMNSPQWVTGRIGEALQFNGVNNYVSVPHSSSISISGNQISVEYWMRLSANWHAEAVPPNTYDQAIYDKEDSYYGAMIKHTGRLLFNVYISGSQIVLETNKNSWDANIWYHIANVYNGDHLMIYVNGVLDKIRPLTGSIRSSSRNLSIGSYCERSPHHFFNGTIDEFAIYNSEITPGPPADMTLTPSSGFAATTVIGSGFSSTSTMTITWDNTEIPTIPNTLVTDTNGNFTALISVPTQSVLGSHTVKATDGAGREASATFTVINMTGSQGSQGPKGDTGPQGPSGESGEVQLVLIAVPAAVSLIAVCLATIALLRKKP